MLQFTYHIRGGYILSLTELNEVLSRISEGPHQWAYAFNESGLDSESEFERTLVNIAYSNPVYPDLPNQIVFQFPLIRLYRAFWDSPDHTYVCIHPDMLRPVNEGLYFEGDQVKGDSLTDITTFWNLLSRAIRSEIPPATGVYPPPPA